MGVVVEFIVFIIIAVIFYIVVLPFINNFGGNSKHKDSGKITKTKEAFKEVGSNYRETKEAISKGFSALEKGIDTLEKESRTWSEKAEKFRLDEYEKDYHRMKQELEKTNKKYRELGLEEISLVDFFAYNKDYQERARKELEALEAKKRAERLLILIDEHNKREVVSKNVKLEEKTDSELSQKQNQSSSNRTQEKAVVLANNNTLLNIQSMDKPVVIDLNNLATELVEFIYIRYYLTGEKAFPQVKCIYDSWAKTPYAETALNEVVWAKIIQQMSFDDSKCKKIDALYHFTHKENLASILSNGLLTKKSLTDKRFRYRYNDEHRWDGMEDTISLSISHPNHKMFMKYAKPTGLENWAILKISPNLLSSKQENSLGSYSDYNYLNKAIFNKFNAASFAMKTLSIEERKSHKAFLDMFESNIGKTLETYTFDNQAEVLYQGDIPKEFIDEIYVIEEKSDLSWVRDLGFKVSMNKTVFEKR